MQPTLSNVTRALSTLGRASSHQCCSRMACAVSRGDSTRVARGCGRGTMIRRRAGTAEAVEADAMALSYLALKMKRDDDEGAHEHTISRPAHDPV
jgi:hypothetical protein